jgi:hypothetical protein
METINNNTDRDLSSLQKILTSFLPYAKERLGYDKPCCVNFVSDIENSKMDFGKTAYYDPSNMEIVIYVDGRHPKDMLRSISHELVHHTQNCRGDFDFQFETKPGYAQNNQKLRELEAEAYLLGNGFLVRDFEDSIKLGDQVLMEWKNKEKKKLLREEADFTKAAAGADEAVEKNQAGGDGNEKDLSQLKSFLGKIFTPTGDQAAAAIANKVKKSLPMQQSLFNHLVKKFGLTDFVSKKGSAEQSKAKQEVQVQNEGKKKKFPDLTGDGKVTKKDVLKGRGVELDNKTGKRDKKEDDEKGDVKEHYITRSEIVGNELMKRWFSKK